MAPIKTKQGDLNFPHSMSNQDRKDWLYANLERDTSDTDAARRNVEKFGPYSIIACMGPTTWPESYGQTPFDNTYLLASRTIKGAA